MTALAQETQVAIGLERDCATTACGQLADRMYEQLAGSYDWPASTVELPLDFDEFTKAHRTARKRASRAIRLGYRFGEVARERYSDDIFEINTSAPERQGRPMSAGYRERVEQTPLPEFPCARHAIRFYGVLDWNDRLRAYTCVYRVGDLVMFSQILGHADHLDDGIMFLLVLGALRDQADAGPGVGFYNLHSSGTEGLRWFKERCGFQAARVRWER